MHVEMIEWQDFTGVFSPAEGLLGIPKMGRGGKKEPAASGNETVFRGSVQHLRPVFSLNGRAAGSAGGMRSAAGRNESPHL